jgi:thioredoxin-like negative regulator of GroEL
MKTIHTLDDVKGFTGIVLFSAPWCGPCKAYKPALIEFCERAGFELGLVDVQAAPALAGTYGVRNVPTTFVFVNGTPSRSKPGPIAPAALKDFAGPLALGDFE